jgi:hypothetical protein
MRFFVMLFLAVLGFCSSGFAQNENYPVPPETDQLLFYIQRNHNANTIVYDANFDENGLLIDNKPIDVYWRRYDEQGQRMELRSIEKWYAYGVDCQKNKNNSNYKVELVAEKERAFWLKQTDAFKAVLLTMINDKLSQVEHMYIFADNSGVWPKVKYIKLFGKDLQTGEKTSQTILIN